jgi:hypothetical protein
MQALKILRMQLIAAMVLTLLGGGTAAVAQNQGSPGAASSTIPQAPIGHRQPRADQVPSGPGSPLANPNDALDKENAILDRKIKGICRGC